MTSRRLAGVMTAAILLGSAAAAHAAEPAPQAASQPADAFEGRVAAAKAAMMTDPPTALQRSLEALDLAKGRVDSAQAEHIATAQWLQGEALLRLNRPDEAAPAIDQGLATATARLPNSKLQGDLPQLCHETVRLWTDRAGAKGLELTLDAAGAPARIVEDSGRLRQILFNLMSNAIKFTEAGGVTLTVRVEPGEAGEELVMAVADTGIGIPRDKLEEVFESFRQVDSSTTRTYEGTGLGLAICRRLAQAMGGDIGLASVLGEGSTVTVRLPLERPAAQAADARADRRGAPRALQDCRVLVCDANPLTQAVIKATLAAQAQSVEAVGSCEEAEGAGGRFDLVLVDAAALGAERQARLASLRALAAAAAPAVVAVLIPDIGEDEAGRLLGAGAAQIIKKPIAASALAGELRDGFTARGEAAAAARRAISAA